MNMESVRQQLHQQIDLLPDETVQIVAEFTAFMKFHRGAPISEHNLLNSRAANLIFETFQSENGKKETTEKTIDRLCGSWLDDPSIPVIFEEIAQQRQRSRPRDITLNLSS